MRRGLLLVGLSMVPGACADRAEPPLSSADLSVLTVNLLTFAVDANVEPRTEAVIALLREKQPDFVALQEAAESSEVSNRAQVIAAAVGYEYVWTATELDEGADYHGGPALLSRWPLTSQDIFDLPHLDFKTHRLHLQRRRHRERRPRRGMPDPPRYSERGHLRLRSPGPLVHLRDRVATKRRATCAARDRLAIPLAGGRPKILIS